MDIIELKLKNRNTNRHPWESAKLKVIYDLIRNIAPNIDLSKSSILDVGCGDLFLIKDLASKFEHAKLLGVDSAFDNNIIKEIGLETSWQNIELFNSVEEIINKISYKVDLVLLLDVIEHIENDIEFLHKLQKSPLISENTYFVITVPAHNYLFSTHDKFLGHYRRYSNKLLKDNVDISGLQVIDVGYFFFILIFPRLCSKIFNLIKGNNNPKQKGVSNWDKGQFLTEIISNILYYDYKFCSFIKKTLNLKIPGLSNYIICKKKPV